MDPIEIAVEVVPNLPEPGDKTAFSIPHRSGCPSLDPASAGGLKPSGKITSPDSASSAIRCPESHICEAQAGQDEQHQQCLKPEI